MMMRKVDIMYRTNPYLVAWKHLHGKYKLYSMLDEISVMIDSEQMRLLQYCLQEKSWEDIGLRYADDLIQEAIQRQWIVQQDMLCRQYNINLIELEVNTQCNYRCDYCPEKSHPKKAAYMDMGLYNRIIHKAAIYRRDHPLCISFNFYNEPLLDPFFENRVRILYETNLKLILNTNASLLNDKVIDILKRYPVTEHIHINIPAFSDSEYKKMTGSSTFAQVMVNIDKAIQAELPVSLVINGSSNDVSRAYNAAVQCFPQLNKRNIIRNKTHDRAGNIQSDAYGRCCHEALYGCRQVLRELVIAADGHIRQCCMDYSDANSTGIHIDDGSLDEILSYESMVNLRKKIFGLGSTNSGFLCHHCVYIEFSKENHIKSTEDVTTHAQKTPYK